MDEKMPFAEKLFSKLSKILSYKTLKQNRHLIECPIYLPILNYHDSGISKKFIWDLIKITVRTVHKELINEDLHIKPR
ncbi:hypothetical protein NCCP28_11080 [Niallia sp. NCCP-28]|nr:hypothetical protein NCCP28_11080 [Niallia sp. NCCP-28]